MAALITMGAGCDCNGGGENVQPDGMGPGPDASVDAPDVPDANEPDALAVMSISEIIPSAASRQVTTTLTVLGYNIAAGATLVLENCDTGTVYDLSATVTVAADGRSLTAELAADPVREQGLYTVAVTNPDGQNDALSCAFRVIAQAPPTVEEVVPSTAYRGISGDGVNSDTVINIRGTGFVSTPNVRWVKTDGTAAYDALFVGYGSSTDLTAVVPSETLGMVAGEYNVFVINPDLLGAQWLVDDGTGTGTKVAGIFTVTETAPPVIDAINPIRIPNATCDQIMTITGSGFDAGATVWWLAPDGTNCAGSEVDTNGNVLCPLTVDNVPDAGTIEAHFNPCPNNGAWPIVVRNPDAQSDTFYNIEVRPNNSGHLDASDFVTAPQPMTVGRFKHAAAFGGDPFGNGYIYVAGGQDVNGAALESVEFTQLDVFGNLSPFAIANQYLDAANPRVINTLTTPRQGATMVRAGRTMFVVGGAAQATDVAGTVSALATVERANILSFDEMPALAQPTVLNEAGLPHGSWYYRISAVGPWGESLATREVVVFNAEGQIELCWEPPNAAGVIGYNIYRSLAADGRANTSTLIATEQPGPCFVDTGAEELVPAPGHVRGTVTAGSNLGEGTHTYRVSAVVNLTAGGTWESYAGYASNVDITAADVSAGNAAIQIKWEAISDATYLVYKWDAASSSYRLLDTGGPLTDPVFVDDGASFAESGTPRTEVRPLPPGSLSLWSDVVPVMTTPREGLDGVVIEMDPATSGGLVARILVAGGRTDNTAGSYLRSAESLGLYEDGTMETEWSVENASFTHARAFYALVTTQGRNATWFPPPPEEPPCADLDNDGYISCDCAPPGTPVDQVDCNDADGTVHPGAAEVCGDGIDQDCDMGCTGTDLPCQCMDDADNDGHISLDCGGDDCCDTAADSGLGCADTTAPNMYPGATEICGNGIDEDCDGADLPCACMDDLDGDGYVSVACGGGDCCDVGTDTALGCTDQTAPGMYPGAPDRCGNAVDENCDGFDSLCRVTTTEPYTPMTEPEAYAPVSMPSAPAVQPATRPIYNVISDEPVYVLALLGDDDFQASANAGRSDIEACLVNDITGRLECTQWAVQSAGTTPQTSFGIDGLLYASYLYPFYGLSRESMGPPVSRQLINASIARFPVIDPAVVANDQVIEGYEAANVSPATVRAYYQALRLMSHIYLIGGWIDAAPTDSIERHIQ